MTVLTVKTHRDFDEAMVTSKAQDVAVCSTGAAFHEQQSVFQAMAATQPPHKQARSNSRELLLPGMGTHTEEEGRHAGDRTSYSSKKREGMFYELIWLSNFY